MKGPQFCMRTFLEAAKKKPLQGRKKTGTITNRLPESFLQVSFIAIQSKFQSPRKTKNKNKQKTPEDIYCG